MPDPLPRLGVDGDQALGEEVVAETVAAVVVAGRGAGRQIDVAEVVIRAERRPDVGVARVPPRFVQPRVGAEVVALRHGPEHPPGITRPRIDPLDPAGRCFLADHEVRDDRRRDDDVARDDRRGRDPHEVAALVVRSAALGPRHALHQVDPAVVAEVADRLSGAGVDPDQVRLARPPEDPGVVAVGPVGQTARPVPVRRVAPEVGLRVVHPEGLAGAGVDRRRLIEGGREVEHAVDHQRRRLQAQDRDRPVLVALAERLDIDPLIDRLPAPGDAEVFEVGGVDLVQRGVLGAAVVAGVAAPFAVDGAVLRGGGLGRKDERGGDGHQTSVSGGHGTPPGTTATTQ